MPIHKKQKCSLIFNIAGPCSSSKHYMLDPLRDMGKELADLIEQEYYFVIHAARQTGKTTLLLNMTKQLNEEGKYHAVYCSLETAYGLLEPKEGIPAVARCILRELKNSSFAKTFKYDEISIGADNIIIDMLSKLCKKLKKPLVIFFDESDCLANGTLISFLRQLRNGYTNRTGGTPFVHSVALVGLRNIRDYLIHVRPGMQTLGKFSPFNIISKSMNLRTFTYNEVSELYLQHTKLTKQKFEQQALNLAYEQTQGQPWLVNAIARECVEELSGKSKTITAEMVREAIQILIKRRDVHFDVLFQKLKEERIKKIIEPMILGEDLGKIRETDDYLYAKDLGLIRDDRGMVEPANPIYAEMIGRALSWWSQIEIEEKHPEFGIPRYFVKSNNSAQSDKIDISMLLKDFQKFWRENSEIWGKAYSYKEAAPHLILQAFLQRVINGGGNIIREFAIGTGRADLCVVYKDKKYPIELKLYKNAKTYQEGTEQAAKYAEKMGCKDAWLFVFDRRKKRTWKDKLFVRKRSFNGIKVTIFGG